MMKHKIYLALLLVLVLTACGTDSHHFKVSGRFIHINQGEFYIYSTDGGINGIDTIKVEAGRFTYEMPCDNPSTLMMVFPNFSEQPIFAEPGKEVSIDGDASHLKEMKVTGTKDNELMNGFREQILSASPQEMIKYAKQFINDNPKSPVSVYLVNKYFIQTNVPDYKTAFTLVKTMLKEQPKNGTLVRLNTELKDVQSTNVGDKLPSFTAYGMNGETASSATVTSAPVAVICVWSSWNYDSMEMLRQLKQKQRTSKGKLKLLSISVDASKDACRSFFQNDSIKVVNICDGEMFEGNVVKKLGMTAVPDNIVLKNGRIIAKGLKTKDLTKKLESLL